MALESVNFLRAFNQFIFTNQPSNGLFETRPYKWAISIHDTNNDPTGVELDDTWYSDSAKRKSIAVVSSWSDYNTDFSNGITNNSLISFDYVPTGESWNIAYYILWGIAEVNNVDQFFPIYVGTFNPVINLTQLQVLQFGVNEFRISPN